MIIKMNTLAEKASLESGFDLFDAVKKEAFSTDKEKNPEKINELVLDCQENFSDKKFNNLLSLIYRTYDIHMKIVETTAGSNKNFLAEDDYFQLYSQVLWKCIMDYDFEKGDFKNYFIKNFRVTFLEEKKNSYMKVKGYVEPEKRKPKSIIVFNNFDSSLGQHSSEILSVENKVLIDEILSCLDKQERELIVFKFLSTEDGEPRSNKEIIEKFNITLNRFEYIKSKAFKKIRENCPKIFDDYMYGKGNNDKIIEFLPVQDEIDVNGSLGGTLAS